MLTRGKLVVLEGMDAAGKASQAVQLAKRLDARLFSFPDYNGPGGHAVKQLLTMQWSLRTSGNMDDPQSKAQAFAIQSFHAVSRYEHAAEIAETLRAGRHVVCDRYYASGLAYGAADGLDKDWLWRIHMSLPQPDCSIFIDITPEESVRRRPDRRDEYEKRAGFMGKVRDAYIELFGDRFARGPGGWHIVDGMGTFEEVAARIQGFVSRVCDPTADLDGCLACVPGKRAELISQGIDPGDFTQWEGDRRFPNVRCCSRCASAWKIQ